MIVIIAKGVVTTIFTKSPKLADDDGKDEQDKNGDDGNHDDAIRCHARTRTEIQKEKRNVSVDVYTSNFYQDEQKTFTTTTPSPI